MIDTRVQQLRSRRDAEYTLNMRLVKAAIDRVYRGNPPLQAICRWSGAARRPMSGATGLRITVADTKALKLYVCFDGTSAYVDFNQVGDGYDPDRHPEQRRWLDYADRICRLLNSPIWKNTVL